MADFFGGVWFTIGSRGDIFCWFSQGRDLSDFTVYSLGGRIFRGTGRQEFKAGGDIDGGDVDFSSNWLLSDEFEGSAAASSFASGVDGGVGGSPDFIFRQICGVKVIGVLAV